MLLKKTLMQHQIPQMNLKVLVKEFRMLIIILKLSNYI